MASCYRCGVSGEDKKLFDAISGKGIVKICEDCLAIERLPIIKKPVEKVEVSQKQVSVRDRLIGMNSKFSYGKEPNLRDLVDQKFKERGTQSHPDLVENFHWTIQRIRRTRRITREDFAKAIGESEATVRMIEQGFLPDNNYKVLAKVESYLGVSFRKNASGFPDTDSKKFVLDDSLVSKGDKESKHLGFDHNSVQKLKIGDLKDIKKKQEQTEEKLGYGKRKDDDDSVEWEEEYTEEDLAEEED